VTPVAIAALRPPPGDEIRGSHGTPKTKMIAVGKKIAAERFADL
jgi:hypothetical protein